MEILIGRRLALDENLCALLAGFGGEPAIFFQKAPADTDPHENFYPQIILGVDHFSDTIKGVAGTLTVDIITAQNSKSPDDIERLVRPRLEGVFFNPPDGEIFSLKWQRSDTFTESASERTPLIVGMTSTFEIYEWPLAETSTPDPIQTLNEWAEQFGAAVIGKSELPEFFEPSREMPAVYFDVQRLKLAEQKSASAWIDATINLHVFAPDVRSRREWLAFLNQKIILQSTFRMTDSSPLRLLDAEYLWAASEIQGQVQFKFQYVVLREIPYAHPIMKRGESFDEKIKQRWYKNVYD